MKKFSNFLFAGVAFSALALFACNGGGDDETTPPTVTLNSGAGFTYADLTDTLKAPLKFNVVATHTVELKKFNITLSTNGGTEASIKDSVITGKNLNFVYNYKVAGSVGDKITLKFSVTDKDGNSDAKSVTITIKDIAEDLELQQNFAVNNLFGPNQGAFDLKNGNGVSAGDSANSKDLLDKTVNTGGSIVFAKAWTSGNGSQFIKITDALKWGTTINSADLLTLWNANKANAKSDVTNIADGDIILVKSGQLSGGITLPYPYYIIKVNKVTETGSDNLDKITFDYKRKPSI